MAVEIKYVVIREGEEKMSFASKKEADAYDKMLDLAEVLNDWLVASPLEMDDAQRDTMAMWLAERKEALQHILRVGRLPEQDASAHDLPAPSAAEELQLPTSSYRFADSEEGFRAAVTDIGLPCIVKPVMSSSGKGQSFIRSADQLSEAWRYAQQGGRAGAGRVIVEGVVNFDFEITLLTVSAVDGVHFCAPVGHRQEDGDYRESWQPQQMSDLALERAQAIARKVVLALGGHGLFGVELFVCGDEVIFSEVSPRPHDTGMVTLISQDLSEFALHVRAFLGLPVGAIRQYGPAASAVILPQLTSQNVSFGQLQSAVGAGLQLRLFGKPEIDGTRRLGVTLAVADSVEEAVARAKTAAAAVIVEG